MDLDESGNQDKAGEQPATTNTDEGQLVQISTSDKVQTVPQTHAQAMEFDAVNQNNNWRNAELEELQRVGDLHEDLTTHMIYCCKHNG